MPQSFANLNVHFIFSTKDRRPSISPEIRPRLYEYVGGIIRNKKGVLLAAGGPADHIHLLVSLAKDVSVSDLIRDIKTNSSKWIHETFRFKKKFAWQSGYGAFSVSYSNLGTVKKYIANQEEHHRRISFREEVITFLKKHNLPYDERYVWD